MECTLNHHTLSQCRQVGGGVKNRQKRNKYFINGHNVKYINFVKDNDQISRFI